MNFFYLLIYFQFCFSLLETIIHSLLFPQWRQNCSTFYVNICVWRMYLGIFCFSVLYWWCSVLNYLSKYLKIECCKSYEGNKDQKSVFLIVYWPEETLILCTPYLRARFGTQVKLHTQKFGRNDLNLSRLVTVSKKLFLQKFTR